MKRTIFITCLLLIFALSNVFAGLASDLITKEEYRMRREKLMKLIPDGVTVILGAEERNDDRVFIQSNDFMYFTGVEIPNAVLIIDGMKKESTLFFTITERTARGMGANMELVNNAKKVTGIENCYPLSRLFRFLFRLQAQTDKIYTSLVPGALPMTTEGDNVNYMLRNIVDPLYGDSYKEYRFIKLLRERFPALTIRDVSPFIAKLRMIKSPAEIELMRKAGRIGALAHIALMKAVKPGMYEYELSAIFNYIVEKMGCQELSYMIIICSGPNHPYLHYSKHDRKLDDGDFLVVDAGPDYNYYDTDITTSFPANGTFTPRQREIYTASWEVHKACMSVYKPGITSADVRQKVEKIMKEKGIDTFGMRGGTGHYVGMSVHDVGVRNIPLQPGMVFANEPLKVFRDENLGVRVEDTILITEEGCENLTALVPREIEEIEELIRKKGIPEILELYTKENR